MASDLAAHGSELLAVAFVVESSLAVANDWKRITGEYVSPMLKRLTETNPGCRLRMGFITYATADTLPSPILCKRFFVDYQPVTKEMREDPAKLGIGQTNSGGERGMAALEGLVAAIELFDILRNIAQQNHQQPIRSSVNHIFHIASASPDASMYPQWNDSPVLDLITWNDIPTEFKKRNISFSSINLRQNIPRFSEIHSAVAPNAPKEPWFPIRPAHTILLAGFSIPLQKPVKRSGDTLNNGQVPEIKRARLGNHPIDASPKIATPKTPSSLPKPPSIAHSPAKTRPLTQSQVPTPAPSQQVPQVPLTNPTSAAQYQNAMAKMHALEEQIRSLSSTIESLRSAGKTAMAESKQLELKRKSSMHQKLQQMMDLYHSKMNNPVTTNPSQMQNSAQETPIAGPSNQNGPPLLPSEAVVPPVAPPIQEDNRIDTQDITPVVPSRSVSGPGPFPNGPQMRMPIPPQAATAVTASQMQKMMEQQQRPRSMIPPQNIVVHSSQNMDMKQSGAVPPPQADPPPQQKLSSIPIWQGSLSWNGFSASGKKEMITFVIANTQNVAMSRSETWPQALTLVPTQDPAVSMQDLQLWIKRHKPVLCTFAAQPNLQDPKGNEASLKTLIQLLVIKNFYAVAAWTRPSGEQGDNVLFFPVNGGLVGAFCPITGISEAPKPISQLGNLFSVSIPPEFAARLQAMTPEQRELVLARVNRQRQQQLQQQQQQQVLMNQGIGGLSNSTANNGLIAMNMLQNQLQQPQHVDLPFSGAVPNYGGMNMMNTMNAMGMGQPQSVVMNASMRMPSMGANINSEMMQSFMQRNSDGSSGMPGTG